jgi:hypothetical protein
MTNAGNALVGDEMTGKGFTCTMLLALQFRLHLVAQKEFAPCPLKISQLAV